MRIAAVIARAKKSVQAGGLPGIVVELSDTLRSDAIPAPLRQAASRLADLLRVPEPKGERIVVPLVSEQPPHAIDAQMRAQHGGVCPFTGHVEGAAPVSEQSQAESLEPAPVEERGLGAAADQVVAELVAEASAAAQAESGAVSADEAAPEVDAEPLAHAPADEAVSAAEQRLEEAKAAREQPKAKKPSASVAPAKPALPAKAPTAKAKQKNEKAREEVAAKPSAAKTSARSSKAPIGKQSGAKKKKK